MVAEAEQSVKGPIQVKGPHAESGGSKTYGWPPTLKSGGAMDSPAPLFLRLCKNDLT